MAYPYDFNKSFPYDERAALVRDLYASAGALQDFWLQTNRKFLDGLNSGLIRADDLDIEYMIRSHRVFAMLAAAGPVPPRPRPYGVSLHIEQAPVVNSRLDPTSLSFLPDAMPRGNETHDDYGPIGGSAILDHTDEAASGIQGRAQSAPATFRTPTAEYASDILETFDTLDDNGNSAEEDKEKETEVGGIQEPVEESPEDVDIKTQERGAVPPTPDTSDKAKAMTAVKDKGMDKDKETGKAKAEDIKDTRPDPVIEDKPGKKKGKKWKNLVLKHGDVYQKGRI